MNIMQTIEYMQEQVEKKVSFYELLIMATSPTIAQRQYMVSLAKQRRLEKMRREKNPFLIWQ